jgi:maltose O-acetyltransferase
MLRKIKQLGVTRLLKILYKSLRNHWIHYRLKRRGILVGYHATFQGKSSISGNDLKIGMNSRIVQSSLDARGGLTIGDNCIIMSTTIFTATHNFHSPTYDTIYKPVIIEDYVIIFSNAIILPGVRIGRGSVVGAGAVVYKDVLPMSIISGNPAQVISQRQCVHDQVVLPLIVSHYTVPELLGKAFRRRSKQ